MLRLKVVSIFILTIAILGFSLAQTNETEDTKTITFEDAVNTLGLGDASIFPYRAETDDIGKRPMNKTFSQLQDDKVHILIKNNNTKKDIAVKLDIYDTVINNQGQTRCGNEQTNVGLFSKKTRNGDILIPAGEQVIKEFDMNFPIGINGKVDACFAYSVGEPVPTTTTDGDSAFTIGVITRGIARASFFVGDASSIDNSLEITGIKTKKNNNGEIILTAEIKNIGNIDSDFTINGEVTNIFGYKKNVNISGGNVDSNKTFPLLINLENIPSYKGLYNIKLTINHKPAFSFDISKLEIDEEVLEEKSIIARTNYFEMPRVILGIVVLIVLLLFLAFRKPKQKVVYVQQPQQPTPNI